ncbi:hypothetical protein GGR58DRAFT_520244 [Xylaria digitata]|nr:hypothetical protein GGR58DRAFT_520244 [Xylaria digitata]
MNNNRHGAQPHGPILPCRPELPPVVVRRLKFLLTARLKDIIGWLPLEIVVMIVTYLEAVDLSHCLRVSRRWRRKLLSRPVMVAFARRRWPALIIDNVTNTFTFSLTLPKVVLANWFGYDPNLPGEGVPYIGGIGEHRFDPIFHPQNRNIPRAYLECGQAEIEDGEMPLYGFGKVAFHPCEGVVVIDDLFLKSRKVYATPAEPLELQALGSKLLIAKIGRKIIAWDHVNDLVCKKRIPCPSTYLTTRDDKVGIVLSNGRIIIWTPDSSSAIEHERLLSTLEPDLNRLQGETWEECLNIFFDPRKANTFFLASGYFITNGQDRTWFYDSPDPSWHSLDATDDPPIHILEYELDHAAIFFSRLYPGDNHAHLAVFDKLKRRFVLEPWHHRPYTSQDWMAVDYAVDIVIKNFYEPTRSHCDGVDLDFMVSFWSGHYHVTPTRGATMPLRTTLRKLELTGLAD